jgi:hypothetical protein
MRVFIIKTQRKYARWMQASAKPTSLSSNDDDDDGRHPTPLFTVTYHISQTMNDGRWICKGYTRHDNFCG